MHNSLVSGRFAVIVFILLTLVMRMATLSSWNDPTFWITSFLQVVVSLVLVQANHIFAIIRNRSMLPAVFYLLMTGSNPALYNAFDGSVAAFGVILSLIFLFDSYQVRDSQVNAFNIALSLGICSLLWSPVLCLLLFIWYGFYKFRCLNYKTFFATLIGIYVVYLFLFSWYFYQDNLPGFLEYVPDYRTFFSFRQVSVTYYDMAVIVFLSGLFVICGFNLFVSGISEKIRNSTILKFLYVLAAGVLVLMIIQSDWKLNWMLILYMPVSFVLSHYFTLSNSRIAPWLLVSTILFFTGIYCWQVLM